MKFLTFSSFLFHIDHDGAEPCGNSVAARNLPLISAYFHDKSYKDRACKLLQFFSSATPFGYALPEMFSAQLLRADSLAMMVIVGMCKTFVSSSSLHTFYSFCYFFFTQDPNAKRLTKCSILHVSFTSLVCCCFIMIQNNHPKPWHVQQFRNLKWFEMRQPPIYVIIGRVNYRLQIQMIFVVI